MWQRPLLTLVLLAVPAVAGAQSTAEKVLPAGSQFYFEWEGFAGHREAYDRTAVGKMMQGETGSFLTALAAYIETQGRAALKNEFDPELVDAIWDDVNGTLNAFFQHGIALGVDVRRVDPADMEAVIVLPGGAAKKKSALSLIETARKLSPMDPVKTIKKGGKTIQEIDLGEGSLLWWAEGKDLVLAVGTDRPDDLLQALAGKTIADNPLYKQVRGFDEFPTWSRGYFDLPSVGKVVSGLSPEVPRIIDRLGLNGIESMTFHSGFDGPAERAVTFLNLKGKRKGLLTLANDKTFSLGELPPMPDDLLAFSATNLDLAALYDVGVDIAQAVANLAAPDQNIDVAGEIRNFEQNNNISIRKELLGNLEPLMAGYASSSEIFLGLGGVSAIKVKDEKKLEKALGKVLDAIRNQAGGFVEVRTTDYGGAKMYTVDLGQFAGANVPTLAVHKGWLVYSNYPQPIKGYILRANGELPGWKAGPEMEKALSKFPERFTGVTVTDPRPAVRIFLSLLPPVFAGINSATAQLGGDIEPFDITVIPNAYEATRHLFPNVTVTTDEGKRLRMETRSSLPLSF